MYVLFRDLHPGNILISEDGEVFWEHKPVVFIVAYIGDLKLTYFGTWDNIQPQVDSQLAEQLYAAPGMGLVHSVTT